MSKKYDSSEFLKKRSAEVDEALLKTVKKGSPASLKLYYQLTGQLIEKQDTTFRLGEVSADDHAKIRQEAARRVQDNPGAADRVGGLLTEPALLPEELCLDTRQNSDEEGKVAIVALSDEPDFNF